MSDILNEIKVGLFPPQLWERQSEKHFMVLLPKKILSDLYKTSYYVFNA